MSTVTNLKEALLLLSNILAGERETLFGQKQDLDAMANEVQQLIAGTSTTVFNAATGDLNEAMEAISAAIPALETASTSSSTYANNL